MGGLVGVTGSRSGWLPGSVLCRVFWPPMGRAMSLCCWLQSSGAPRIVLAHWWVEPGSRACGFRTGIPGSSVTLHVSGASP